MKFVDAPDLEQLAAALCFDTPDCHITHTIDLYTTKAAGTDKKLYKTLDKQLATQHQDSLNFYQHFQDRDRDQLASSNNGSHDFLAPSLIPSTNQSSKFTTTTTTTTVTSSNSTIPLSLRRESVSSVNTSASSYTQTQGHFSTLMSPPAPPPITMMMTPSTKSFDNSMPYQTARTSPKSSYSSSVNSNLSISPSPFGPLDQSASRKAYAYIISTLNASHPDHDFSSLQPTDFQREHSLSSVMSRFNNTVFGLGMPVPPQLWECLDNYMDLKDSHIYSLTPSSSSLTHEPGSLWSMMWFFFNKRRKRVCYMSVKATRLHYGSATMNYHSPRTSPDEDDEGNSEGDDNNDEPDHDGDTRLDRNGNGSTGRNNNYSYDRNDSLYRVRKKSSIYDPARRRRMSINGLYDEEGDDEYDLTTYSDNENCNRYNEDDDAVVGDLELE
ncbi:repressor of RNA polymerase III transcription MAF1 [Nadsonia fulvescens var. elongata DSM 6958]|uniref:Repressor of RNA polymerase III transcription MAF1 n=1 Tax=Nadsonia fulvescens var. elongata DSM 6958 TaxID=857566 RepID=A0A1E3PN26_9ASCO|nr:repressor of RNA polymerase III transcription MAF1 [Nadsonia fulvescens var. elongata DSM 6958]